MIKTLINRWINQIFRDKFSFLLTVATSPLVLIFYRLSLNLDSSFNQVLMFNNFVPDFTIFAMIMTVFSSAMALSREKERGLFVRYKLCDLSQKKFIIAYMISQFVLGVISLGVLVFSAYICGFNHFGYLSLFYAVLSCGLCTMIFIGVIISMICKTGQQAFLFSSLIMFLLLIFSGTFVPLPKSFIFDLIPTVHIKKLLQKIMLDKDVLACNSFVILIIQTSILAIFPILFFKFIPKAKKEK